MAGKVKIAIPHLEFSPNRMDQKTDLALLKEIIRQLMELDKLVKSKLRILLKGKNHEQIKEVLRELDASSLHMICEMSLPNEDYEICHAVQEVLKEKED